MNLPSRILHSPLLMSIIGVVLAFSIMWKIADATLFRVNLPVYPGAQQVKAFGDSDKLIMTFVTQDTAAQVLVFYKGSFSSEEWYDMDTSSESQKICCYNHVKERRYMPNTGLVSSIHFDYGVGIDFLSEQENTFVKITANQFKDNFNDIIVDYQP